VDSALSGTRGCVMGLVRFRRDQKILECALAGDIRAQVYHLKDSHFFAATPGIVGDRELLRRRIRVQEIPVKTGSVLAMFSDGLETKTNLKDRQDLLRRPAIVITQHLLATHSRGTDDSMALVARIR